MQKENNKKIIWVVAGVVVLGTVFYGGMVYGKSQVPVRGQGAQAFSQNGMMRGNRNGGGFGGFTGGQIISKDANSITIQIMNGGNTPTGQQGGSKIIFLDSNTKITKSVDGTAADLVTGEQVSISGAANADGSINAQSVQIRSNIASGALRQ
jgi:hypothetical protein